MSVTDLILLGIMPILLILSGLFSGTETALFGLTRTEELGIRQKHPAVAANLEAMRRSPRRLLVLVLLLNMAVNIAYFVISAGLAERIENHWVGAGFAVGSLLVIVLVGEVFAKLLAASHREVYVRLITKPFFLIWHASKPVIFVLDHGLIAPMTRLVHPPGRKKQLMTEKELSALIQSSAEQGHIDQDEHRLLVDVLQLGQIRAREIMTPRLQVVWVEKPISPEHILKELEDRDDEPILLSDTHCGGTSIQQICVPELLARWAGSDQIPDDELDEVLSLVGFIPDTITLDRLLDHFQSTQSSVGACVDEHGTVAGIVTLKALIAELFRIQHFGNRGEKAQEIRMISMARWSVPASLGVTRWAEMFDEASLVSGIARVGTLGGLIMLVLGRVPKVGDKARLGNVIFEVESMSGRAIDRVIVGLDVEKAEGSESGGELRSGANEGGAS